MFKPKKLLLAALLIVSLLIPYTAEATLVYSVPTASVQNTIYKLIGKQNFSGSGLTAAKAQNYAKHFLTKSKWRPGQKFSYPNRDTVYKKGKISDGTFSCTVGSNMGCYRYSAFVTGVVYGRTGSRKYFEAKKGTLTKAANVAKFKKLIQTQAQFGEHIRINNKHSMTFLGCDDKGMYVLEYGSPGKIAYQYRTYASFCNSYNNVAPEKGKSYAVWIYNACTAVNKSGTSSGSQSPAVSKKTGYVIGTDGSLAINSKPAAGNQIGLIPEGAAVQFDPAKTSGKWYYVTYNGKSGYSYSTYITTSKPATKTGTIKGTDGNLAIRASANSSSKMRGKIPEGRTCTVFTGRKSGSWIWVKYGNVAGWSFAKYIKY